MLKILLVHNENTKILFHKTKVIYTSKLLLKFFINGQKENNTQFLCVKTFLKI